jgi:hypothetical protein
VGLAGDRQAAQVERRGRQFSHPASMSDSIRVGDPVRIFLNSQYWNSHGWFDGTVTRIEPYSGHRSFYWVELEEEVQDAFGNAARLISVLNPSHIVKR